MTPAGTHSRIADIAVDVSEEGRSVLGARRGARRDRTVADGGANADTGRRMTWPAAYGFEQVRHEATKTLDSPSQPSSIPLGRRGTSSWEAHPGCVRGVSPARGLSAPRMGLLVDRVTGQGRLGDGNCGRTRGQGKLKSMLVTVTRHVCDLTSDVRRSRLVGLLMVLCLGSLLVPAAPVAAQESQDVAESQAGSGGVKPQNFGDLNCRSTVGVREYPWGDTLVDWSVVDRSVPDASIWTGHRVGQDLAADGEALYVAYYDADRRMTVGYRKDTSREWDTYRIPGDAAVVGWDSHNGISIGVDQAGNLHVAGNMHGDQLRYWRTSRPGDITSLERVHVMVSEGREDEVTYPEFVRGPKGNLVFKYRDGRSGSGLVLLNIFDIGRGQWDSATDIPLFDGHSETADDEAGESFNPYVSMSAEPNSEGYYEMVWVWRRTPDVSTNSRLSYMRSKDLSTWKTVEGAQVDLPVTYDTSGVVVDDVPEGGGLWNGGHSLTEGPEGTPMIAYYKDDDRGQNQIYVARPPEAQASPPGKGQPGPDSPDGKKSGKPWKVSQVTDWIGSAPVRGLGTLESPVQIGSFELLPDGNLSLPFRCMGPEGRASNLLLDPDTLDPIAETSVPEEAKLPRAVREPAETTPAVTDTQVRTVEAAGNRRYAMVWQNQGSNQDRPFEQTPPALPLEVYELAPASDGDAAEAGEDSKEEGGGDDVVGWLVWGSVIAIAAGVVGTAVRVWRN